MARFWKVGELARQTGLTVRTLHHYDAIGLLSPQRRSEAGYRLYSEADVLRLQQIRSLRQMGFPLPDIRALLDHPGHEATAVVGLHTERLRHRIDLQQELLSRLEALLARLAEDTPLSSDELLHTIEVMSMTEKFSEYYTPEQMAYLEQRRREVGEDRIHEVEGEWPRLIAEMRAEYERGADPASEHVQDLARRWRSLVSEFTGGDPGIAASLGRMYQDEPGLQRNSGIDPDLMAFVQSAMNLLP